MQACGALGDTTPATTWDFEPSRLTASFEEGDNRSVSVTDVPFAPSPTWTYSPLGYMVGGTRSTCTSPPSGYCELSAATGSPFPCTPPRSRSTRITTAGMRQTDPAWRWDGDPILDRKPPFKGIYVGERGTISVWLHQPAEQ